MHSFQQNFNKTTLPSSSETYVLEKTECLHLTAEHSSLNNFGRSQWIAMGKKSAIKMSGYFFEDINLTFLG